MLLSVVIEKVCGFNVSMYYASFVYICQSTEQAQEIMAQIIGQELPVVQTKVEMAEIR